MSERYIKWLELYKIASENWRHEGTMRWIVFTSFLAIHSALFGFLVKYTIDPGIEKNNFLVICIGCIAGIVLAKWWQILILRANCWFEYRILRAREIEEQELKEGNSIVEFLSGRAIELIESGETHFFLEKGIRHIEFKGPLTKFFGDFKTIPKMISILIILYILDLIYSIINKYGCYMLKLLNCN